ncbi:MAG TPA: MFS transporter [Mycobacteriales bacterium]|nr:MFS transporter [Mycobacteriales bacterium]
MAAAVCQPLAGRVADQFGARRVFCLGLLAVCLTGALAPLSPSFGWLVGFRVAQAAGTSVAFPCALVLIRAAGAAGAGTGARPPAAALGVLSVASSVSAALGPVLGGVLVSLAGWQAIFLANVPVTLAGLAAALAWLPADRVDRDRPEPPATDVVGVALFALGLAGLLGFLLSVPGGPVWPLLPVGPVAAGLLVVWERRVDAPFLDVRMLAGNRPLMRIYGQFAAVNVAFYAAFYALPLWFERERGMPPRMAGLLLLPVAGLGLVATPAAVRLIARRGIRLTMLVGTATLCAGSVLLLGFGRATPIWVIVLACSVLGLPNGFTNLGLQASLFAATPPDGTGAAAGLFQTSRYLGAILSTSLLGVVFARSVNTAGLRAVATVMVVISALLVASVTAGHSPSARTRR